MVKSALCAHCAIYFIYNDSDRGGIFCSQKCHYASKSHEMNCRNCNQEFIKKKRDKRTNCSFDCYRQWRKKSKEEKRFKQQSIDDSQPAHVSTVRKFIGWLKGLVYGEN